jgi:FKBP-type peptidyl-prolyl cis-trans isomerase FkpA
MNKIKNIFLLLLLAVIVMYSCDDDSNALINPFADVNYEELAITDNDSIVKFLKDHYYNSDVDSIKLISSTETSIFDSGNIVMKEMVRNDINYKLYTFVIDEGNPDPDKGFPSVIDSVFTNYTGVILANNTIDISPFDKGDQSWLTNTIPGWANGFINFKSGKNVTNNGPITYQDTGKGYIFVPSGLAYPSLNYQPSLSRPYDEILVFKIELLDLVVDTDHDNDGTPSIQEDANGDGDPTNDFSDNSKPNLPDYLNPDIN